jgi:hypothetical protein
MRCGRSKYLTYSTPDAGMRGRRGWLRLVWRVCCGLPRGLPTIGPALIPCTSLIPTDHAKGLRALSGRELPGVTALPDSLVFPVAQYRHSPE